MASFRTNARNMFLRRYSVLKEREGPLENVGPPTWPARQNLCQLLRKSLDCPSEFGQGRRLAMNRTRSPEEIVRTLQEAATKMASGLSAGDVARQLGINPGTLSRWRSRYGGIQLDEAKKIMFLEK